MPMSTESREFDRVRQAVLLGLFSGTGIGLGYLLFHIPGLELMTLSAALAGAALGPRLGAVAGGLAMGVFSLAHPLGTAVPVVMAAQVTGMALAGGLGGLVAPALRRLPLRAAVALAAAVGVTASIAEDLLTNLAVAVAFGWPTKATLAAGLPIAAWHAGINAAAFGLVLPGLARRLARLRRPGPRVVRSFAGLVLVATVASAASAQLPAAADSLAADAETKPAAADSVMAAVAADSLARLRADANEVVFNRAASPRRFVNDWQRPLWDPFFGSLLENLGRRTFWIPVRDGGLGGAVYLAGEPGTSFQPLVSRDGIPLGIGHRYLDDIEAVAITGQTMRATNLGFDRSGGLAGTVDLEPYDPVPDRDLADTRWYKGKHETYLRDLHFLTANAPWRFGFDYQEILDNEGYDFRVDGESRYSQRGDPLDPSFWGHAKFRSGRGILQRDLGSAGVVTMSLENVRKLKSALPAYDMDHQDLWVNRAALDWRGQAATTPIRVGLWWTDTDADWDRDRSTYRKQEGARTGALVAWGAADHHGRLDLTWGRWTIVDSGADPSWSGGDTLGIRLQGELANLQGRRTWSLGWSRTDLTVGGWWDEHGGWLLGGAAELSEDRSSPRWSLRLERGGRAPRSDELATDWRFVVPDGRQTVALANPDLGREAEWRLALGVSPRLLGFQLAVSGALRRLRDGIGWGALAGETDVGRWENGFDLDSATMRAAVSRGGRFLGWVRLRAEGSYRTWKQHGDLHQTLPPETDWQISALWENHFFQEDGVLQLAIQAHNRGAMNDPWYLASPVPLPAYTRVDGIAGFRLVGTNLSAEILNLTGAATQTSAGAMADGFQVRWRLNWVFHF